MATKVTSSLIDYTSSSFTGNFRNKIINGNFDVWQRGTSLISGTTSRYLADRFQCSAGGSSFTPSRQPFTFGQTNVPGDPTYFHSIAVTSAPGPNNYVALVQRIESVRTLAGRTATVSFYAKADAAKNIAVELVQDFGTGTTPTPSADEKIFAKTCALTTSWQKFTATVNIPSLAGKTLGPNGDDHLRLNLWFDAGSTYNSRTNSLGQQSGTFDIARVQLEEGPVATPFEERFMGTELALCYRYYQKEDSRIHNFPAGGYSEATHDIRISPMRSTPTTSVTVLTSGNFLSGGTLLYGVSPEKIRLQGDHVVSSGSTSGYVTYSWTADAEIH